MKQDILFANWSNDLPLCEKSGIGYLANIIYRADGGQGESTEYEDATLNYKGLDDCLLYGIFDGHNGARVAQFAQHKLVTELCFGQLSDEEVYKKLNEVFENVSKEYIDSIMEPLMGKITLEETIEGIDPYVVQQKYPQLFEELNEFKAEISSGCSVAIALIHNSRLFVANVGDTRVLLCRAAENNCELGVVQLSIDHTVSTISELQRLSNLGIDIEQLQTLSILQTTRSLGDWNLKAGYKNNFLLSAASEEPILSTPSIHGGEEIDNSMKFLILMTRGVYHAYMHATDTPPEEVNFGIASLVEEEIAKQTSVRDVAQAVVNRICQMHNIQFVKSQNTRCLKRDDMTLLVKLFNIELGSARDQHQSRSVGFFNKLANSNLPPLIMPSCVSRKRVNTPNSTGSDTPSTATPGSAKSATATSPFSVCSLNTSQFSNSSPLTATASLYNPELIFQREQTTIKTYENPPDMKMFINESDPPEPVLSFDQDISLLKIGGADSSLSESWQANLDRMTLDCNKQTCNTLSDNLSKSYSNSSQSCKDSVDKIYCHPEPLELDENGRIKAFVDFSEFIKKVEEDGGERTLFPELFS